MCLGGYINSIWFYSLHKSFRSPPLEPFEGEGRGGYHTRKEAVLFDMHDRLHIVYEDINDMEVA